MCQSMPLSVSMPGFERKSESPAIKTDIVSISSFFSRQNIFLIADVFAPMLFVYVCAKKTTPLAPPARYAQDEHVVLY